MAAARIAGSGLGHRNRRRDHQGSGRHGWVDLSPEDERRCRSIDGLFAVWREYDNTYRLTLHFSRIIAKASPYFPELDEVEPGNLHRYWKNLSEFCHFDLRPETSFGADNREFQERGYSLVNDVLESLGAWNDTVIHGVIDLSSAEPEVRDLYESFVSGELDETAVATRFEIMKPVLEERFRRRS